jgi:hypothetical protein
MSDPAMPVVASETLSPFQQKLALFQLQAGAQIVKDILMPMAAIGVGLDTNIESIFSLYPPELLIVLDLFNMAHFNIMKKILVQAGATIPSGRGYPIVKNVIRVLYSYNSEGLNEAQDMYSALSPGNSVPATHPLSLQVTPLRSIATPPTLRPVPIVWLQYGNLNNSTQDVSAAFSLRRGTNGIPGCSC